MSQFNPYAAPSSDAVPPIDTEIGGDEQVAPEIREALAQTRPWVNFMGILGFIGVGLLALGGLGVMVLGGQVGGEFAGLRAGIGVAYLVLAALYVFPSLALLRYASSIAALLRGDGNYALVQALRNQKSFWRFVGIMTAIGLVLYFIGLVVVFATRG